MGLLDIKTPEVRVGIAIMIHAGAADLADTHAGEFSEETTLVVCR
jgi:hypothetical protein